MFKKPALIIVVEGFIKVRTIIILTMSIVSCQLSCSCYPWTNIIKLLQFSYKFLYKAGTFVPGKLFQPSLMNAGKAGTYPNEAPFSAPL
jgi:hypothetical protein